MAKRKFDPVHPGVILAEDFLKEMEISQYRLAKGIGSNLRLAMSLSFSDSPRSLRRRHRRPSRQSRCATGR